VSEANTLPSIAISPRSGVIAPLTHLISVDFPAPFAPRRAWVKLAVPDGEIHALQHCHTAVRLRQAADGERHLSGYFLQSSR
jgi:hypothetical protein